MYSYTDSSTSPPTTYTLYTATPVSQTGAFLNCRKYGSTLASFHDDNSWSNVFSALSNQVPSFSSPGSDYW